MTIGTECPLAAEAGLSYCAIAMATDYDCWKEGEEAVTVDAVMKVMATNAENVKRLLLAAIPAIAAKATATTIEEKAAVAAANVMGH